MSLASADVTSSAVIACVAFRAQDRRRRVTGSPSADHAIKRTAKRLSARDTKYYVYLRPTRVWFVTCVVASLKWLRPIVKTRNFKSVSKRSGCARREQCRTTLVKEMIG